MSPVIERLAELRSHLDHLAKLVPRVPGAEALRTDMSLRNDVLFSLFMASQLVIDIAAELSARSGRRFADYTGAIRNLELDRRFPAELVRRLEKIPDFRNVIVHEYVVLDLDLAVTALHDLEVLEKFVSLVAIAEAAPLAE